MSDLKETSHQLTMKQPTIESFRDYYNSVMAIVERLTNLDTKVMDIFAVLMLRGLHERLHNVVSLIAQSEQELTLTVIAKRVETKLEMTLQPSDGKETTGNALHVRHSSFRPAYRSDQCRYCRQTGHWAKDCPSAKNNRTNINSSAKSGSGSSASAHAVSGPVNNDGSVSLGNLWLCGNDSTSDNWFFDGGASKHMCKDSTMMRDYSSLSNSYVTVANGERLPVVGKGDVPVQFASPDGQIIQRVLKNVLHVPGIIKNLISNHELASVNGVKVIEGSPDLDLRLPNGTELPAGKWDPDYDAYRFIGDIIDPHHAHAFASSPSGSTDVLHRRFAHIGHSQLNEYVKQGLIAPPTVNRVCPACAEGKSHRLPYERSTSKPLHPLHELHTDVLGPFDVDSVKI